MKGNKRESVRNLHMQTILNAAEKIFTVKGYENTTIDDICKSADYSRRTVYTYFPSKEEIYSHIVLKGLKNLKSQLSEAVSRTTEFMTQYEAICEAMVSFFQTSPHSFSAVENFQSKSFDFNPIPQVIKEIFLEGEEINQIIEQFIQSGKDQRIVKSSVRVKESTLILWTSISGVLSLVQNKGDFIEKAIGTSIEEFTDYSFKQIIGSILEEGKSNEG